MTEDDWVTDAMAAEILVKLRAATLPLPSKRGIPAPPQSWTIHQRRSRTQPLHPASNKLEEPRASPTTPLSWTGATPTQPNHNRSDIPRSKVTPPRGTTTKRPRKKKTLAALKREEVVLMEEQDNLKRKLEALQANREKQIKENVRLSKIKLDILVEPQGERPREMRNNHFEVVDERNDRIVLPDLNVPFREDVIMSY
ncbi:hypothetical protein L1987_51910 [Smallanthus sonchifolius]|uniref:Uncharacterized protein n=1 Tax=Smallanthus sonchifolius TaxID=185202 RepID=A0ACB9ESD5_9ASTR|nr:hypothetical protein L1987_51910 [Smallanthus sonchifolius]